MIDTTVVAKHFSNAAKTYDALAEPQTITAHKLTHFLPHHATRILDLGCGTGIMTAILREKYPESFITGLDPAPGMIEQARKRFSSDAKSSFVVATAEEFLAPTSFDLIVSTNSFQWFHDKKRVLDNINHSLTPDGHFVIATPLRKTLLELYESYHMATGNEIYYADLFTAEKYTALFLDAPLSVEKALVDEFLICSPTPEDVIHFLQGIGGAPHDLRADSLLPEEQLNSLINHYIKKFSISGGVAVTYQYLFAVCRPHPR